jgi:hypothetical protein
MRRIEKKIRGTAGVSVEKQGPVRRGTSRGRYSQEVSDSLRCSETTRNRSLEERFGHQLDCWVGDHVLECFWMLQTSRPDHDQGN